MNFIGSKEVTTERLLLRPTIEEDLKVLWEILCIPEVNKYYLTCKFNLDWENEKKWQYKKLERATDCDMFQWSIVLKENNECIGQISVQEKGEDKAVRDIGWFINPQHQRKGYAFEAASAVIKYMFEDVSINAIDTGVAICNSASWKLMEKLGFIRKETKTHLNHYTFGGEVEGYSYIMRKEEYNAKK